MQKIILVFIIFSSNVILAQPDPDRIPGDQNALDGPIDNWVLSMIFAVIVFGFVKYSKLKSSKYIN